MWNSAINYRKGVLLARSVSTGKSITKKSAAKTKAVIPRSPRTGFGFTRRGGRIEATYNIPKSQLAPGSTRKRITAWGDTEKQARDALLLKLTAAHVVAISPAHLTAAHFQEARQALGADGADIRGTRRALYQDDAGPLLKDWIDEWLKEWISPVQSSTRKIYEGHIRTYILPYLGDYHLNDLSAKVLKQEWWNKIRELREIKDGEVTDKPVLGTSAQRNVYKTLRLILTTASRKLGTRVSLTEKLIKMPEQVRPESDREVKAAARRLRKIFIDEPDKDDPRWSLYALALLGLRQSERLAISVSDFDRDDVGMFINIHNQLDFDKDQGGWYLKDTTKNGDPRVVPIWGIFQEAVIRQMQWRNEWKSRPDWNSDPEFADLLFLQPGGKLWTRRQDAPMWHEYVGPNIRGHLARHVTGHLLAEEGISLEVARILLGHRTQAWGEFYRVVSTRQVRRGLEEYEQARETSVITNIWQREIE